MPVVDAISVDYQDAVRFVAVAGKAGLSETRERASELFSNLEWGLDDSIWDLYDVPYQPVTVLISGDDRIVDTWPGVLDESELRRRIDELTAY